MPVHVWYNGLNSLGASQDDMAVIASSTNTFGYRPDDHGNTASTATALTNAGNTWSGAGIVGTTADVDMFSFTVSTADTYRMTVPTGRDRANLDSVLELRTSTGTLLATASPTDSQGAELLPGT